jgi:hypothetical protein
MLFFSEFQEGNFNRSYWDREKKLGKKRIDGVAPATEISYLKLLRVWLDTGRLFMSGKGGACEALSAIISISISTAGSLFSNPPLQTPSSYINSSGFPVAPHNSLPRVRSRAQAPWLEGLAGVKLGLADGCRAGKAVDLVYTTPTRSEHQGVLE